MQLAAHGKAAARQQFSHSSDLHHSLTIPHSEARLNYTPMSKRCCKHVRGNHRAQAPHLPTDRSFNYTRGRRGAELPRGTGSVFHKAVNHQSSALSRRDVKPNVRHRTNCSRLPLSKHIITELRAKHNTAA